MGKLMLLPSPDGGQEVSDIERFIQSFCRHLKAEGKAEITQFNYPRTVARFRDFLRDAGMPTNVHDIGREHVEAYIESLIGEAKGAATTQTPRNYYYHLKAFFNFLVDVYEEIEDDPMRNMTPPKVVERVINKAAEVDVAAVLKTCAVPRDKRLPAGVAFLNLRDEALIRMMIDAGPRRSEVTRLRRDVDLDRRVAVVMGKGASERTIVFGAKTARSLDRYLIKRERHRYASLDHLWIGAKGALTADGVYQMLVRRAALVGIHMTPHQLRHAWAHALKVSGMRDEELMVLGGWRSDAMMRHYGRSASAERAAATHAQMSPGDSY